MRIAKNSTAFLLNFSGLTTEERDALIDIVREEDKILPVLQSQGGLRWKGDDEMDQIREELAEDPRFQRLMTLTGERNASDTKGGDWTKVTVKEKAEALVQRQAIQERFQKRFADVLDNLSPAQVRRMKEGQMV